MSYRNIYPELPGEFNLNIGCGRNHEKGFVTLDKSEDVGADVLCDLETVSYRGPQWENKFDFVLASHILEHIENLVPLMDWIYKVLKPGGHLLAVTPHAGSDSAWSDPTHVRAFTPNTFQAFSQDSYVGEHHGNYKPDFECDFEVVRIEVVPYEEYRLDPDIERKVKEQRNIVQEIRAILRKRTNGSKS